MVLVVAVIVVYLPVWRAGFIWDDDDHLTENPCIIGPLGLKEIWTTSEANISPLTRTMFWLEHAVWGLAPLPYHLVNVLLHAAVGIVLWRLLRLMEIPGAWWGAALWALHPVEVESVAWISEMKNTESALFFLLSILFFLRWLGARGNWNYGLMFLFASLSIACKTTTVILPVILCLAAWWTERRWRWRNLALVAPVLVLSAAGVGLSMWIQNMQLDWYAMPARTWPQRVIGAGDAVWFYLGKIVWPHPLVTIYPPFRIDPDRWIAYLPALGLVGLGLIFWLKRGSWGRPWFFALAYFLAALLSVIGLVNSPIFDYSLVFDHFQYLASMGPLALAGAGLARLGTTSFQAGRWLQPAVGSGLLLILGFLSWQRTWAYESEETLWSDTLAKNPDCWVGLNNLGLSLEKQGLLDQAIADYEKAVAIKPNFIEGYNDLGTALIQKGQWAQAEREFHAALAIKPDFVATHLDLGYVLLKEGRLDEATVEFKKALAIDPTMAQAHYNLGLVLARQGRKDEASAEYQAAQKLNPNYPEACNSLGILFFQDGEYEPAMAQFEHALSLNPNFFEARSNLATTLAKAGRTDEAIGQYRKILALNPNLPQAHYNLGGTLLQSGRVEEAIGEFQAALNLAPNFAEAHNNLGIALIQAGRPGEAVIEFQEALRINPSYAQAQAGLARAKAALGSAPATPKP
jgi:tetratricopeptide (TPR) repeat protein